MFVTTDDANREPPEVAAAANWHALATFVGPIPAEAGACSSTSARRRRTSFRFVDRQPVPAGRTDPERLRSGELVYTGVRRTPVCASSGEGRSRVVRHHPRRVRAARPAAAGTGEPFDGRRAADDAGPRPRPAGADARRRFRNHLAADVRPLAERAFSGPAGVVAKRHRPSVARRPGPPATVVLVRRGGNPGRVRLGRFRNGPRHSAAGRVLVGRLERARLFGGGVCASRWPCWPRRPRYGTNRRESRGQPVRPAGPHGSGCGRGWPARRAASCSFPAGARQRTLSGGLDRVHGLGDEAPTGWRCGSESHLRVSDAGRRPIFWAG